LPDRLKCFRMLQSNNRSYSISCGELFDEKCG
jgi:hypothetical protein